MKQRGLPQISLTATAGGLGLASLAIRQPAEFDVEHSDYCA